MNRKQIIRGVLGLLLLLVVSSFTLGPTPLRFSPVGTWEYEVPGVETVYEKGSMIIEKDEKDYKVTMLLNEYSKTEAENVSYKRKTISFTIWVENEEILVTGTFDGDQFTGTISYSDGNFSITASRDD